MLIVASMYMPIYYSAMSFGGYMGNPNPQKQAYVCQICGAPRPPYQFYCDKHLKDGERNDKPLLIDRFMNRQLGRSYDKPLLITRFMNRLLGRSTVKPQDPVEVEPAPLHDA